MWSSHEPCFGSNIAAVVSSSNPAIITEIPEEFNTIVCGLLIPYILAATHWKIRNIIIKKATKIK
jgi:hypothetical protein